MAKSKLDKMREEVERVMKTKEKIKFVEQNASKIENVLCDGLDVFPESAMQKKVDDFVASLNDLIQKTKKPITKSASTSVTVQAQNVAPVPTENATPTA